MRVDSRELPRRSRPSSAFTFRVRLFVSEEAKNLGTEGGYYPCCPQRIRFRDEGNIVLEISNSGLVGVFGKFLR